MYMLADNNTGEPLSKHPNVEGAQISALFHVANGEKVEWMTADGPVSVASHFGLVAGVKRFKVYQYN